MSEWRLVGGATVSCRDGACGLLGRIVLDPSSRVVTHLAVEPSGFSDAAGRLVPIDTVQGADDEVRLGCDRSEFEAFGVDEVTEARPISEVVSSMTMMTRMPIPLPGSVVLHQVPEGEIEINSVENIEATDGPAGHLLGLTIDSAGFKITHLLLRVGHLMGRREVSLPIETVTAIDGEQITLSLSRSEVQAFS